MKTGAETEGDRNVDMGRVGGGADRMGRPDGVGRYGYMTHNSAFSW